MARREVIVSAGVFQTPQLLMLSGVGDAPELAKVGIGTIHHLPGVGRNLHDHPDFVFGYTSDDPDFFGASFASSLRMMQAIAEYERNQRGPISSNFAEGGGFLKSRSDLDAPDLQLHFAVAMVDDHGRKFHWGGGFSCHVAYLRPKSRGSVWLKSTDPLQAPAIDPNFFDDPDDLEAMVTGFFKMTQTLMDAPILKALRKAERTHAPHPYRRRHSQCAPGAQRHGLPPRGDLQDGRQRPNGRGRSDAEGLRARGSSDCRRLDYAHGGGRQHQRSDRHDRRKGGRHHQG
jgi:choline dehydrogenase-like flavoprotein